MRVEDIKNVCAVGTGTMGLGIALFFAMTGDHQVRLYVNPPKPEQDTPEARAKKIEDKIKETRAILMPFVDHYIVDEADVPKIMARIHPTYSLEEAGADADIVYESISENMSDKQNLFSQLDVICPAHTIFATGTSALSPTGIAEVLPPSRQANFVVAHGFNPPHLIPLIEIVPGENTSADTVHTTSAVMDSIGKKSVVLMRESPGFVGNKVQVHIISAACELVSSGHFTAHQVDAAVRKDLGLLEMDISEEIKSYLENGPVALDSKSPSYIIDYIKDAMLKASSELVENKIATPDVIEKALKASLALRYPETGPLESSDLGGLDIFHKIYETLAIAVPELIHNAFNSKHFGSKTGRGIYEWTLDAIDEVKGRRTSGLFSHLKLGYKMARGALTHEANRLGSLEL